MASTIKVDNVQNQPGTNVINKCGTTVTVGACGNTVNICGASVVATGNVVKSNALQASDGGNIVNQCGTDITLGASGDTINLASGASQSGFGRTGTVDWVTTPKVTGDSPVTAATGSGYFLNTTSGTITINLPAGAAGSIVSMADYAGTWQTNKVTVAANGSEKIGGRDADATLNTEGQSVTFVYVDGTQGWINTMDSTSNVRGLPPYIVATVTGACNTLSTAPDCGDMKIATFLGPGTFCVSSGGGACAPCSGSGSNLVDYLVVAGGGAGQSSDGPGAGAGGYRESNGTSSGCYTTSPKGTTPTTVPGLPVSVQGYPITVGAGGAASASAGSISTFSTVDSAGGGAGNPSSPPTGTGGSGSGGYAIGGSGGAGNTPPTTPPQGENGGTGGSGSPTYSPGGGGGAGGVGANAPPTAGGAGGVGVATSISGSSINYAGGGGGGRDISRGGSGGAGSPCGTGGAAPGGSGTANRGGGGGGGRNTAPSCAGLGGSGIVIIRYKFQN